MRSAGRSPFCKGRRALPALRNANKRLNTAYLPQGVLCQLWGYQTRERGPAPFPIVGTRASSGSGSRPIEKGVTMIDRHWDGIASSCHPENRVSLGLVEGGNNKIPVL